MALTTPQSQTVSAGTNLDLVAQRDTNQTSGRRWIHNAGQHISLFVAGVKDQIALKLIAAKGKVQLQAQSDDIELTADKNARLTAIKGKSLFNAKQEILLTAGGAYIRIKGGSHDWGRPASLNVAPPSLPKAENKKNWLELNYRYKNMQPVVGATYTVLFADGTQQQGTLDNKGHAKLEGIPAEGVQEIIYGWDSRDAEPWVKAPANPILGQKPSNNEEAALLLEQYLEAETEYLEDNYFPDEIEAMLNEKYGAEPLYEQHYDDYVLDSKQQPRVDYSKEHPQDPPVNSGEQQ